MTLINSPKATLQNIHHTTLSFHLCTIGHLFLVTAWNIFISLYIIISLLFCYLTVVGDIHSFHWHAQNATIPCRTQELLPFSLLCTFYCHASPPTILPSSRTSSCHLFLGLPLNLVVPKFIYNTLLGILFSCILHTCPNQRILFNLIVYVIVGFLTIV